jgi:hypothetical protein
MKIQNGVIFIWAGTHAAIPAGWSRVTALDDKYLKGSAVSTDPNTTGGTSTHTHYSPAHSHSANNDHNHTIYLSQGNGSSHNSTTGSGGSRYDHTHAAIASGSRDSVYISYEASTYSAVSNDPYYYKVIYVTPTTTAATLPAGLIGLADSSAPTGFSICDGSGSTPNLVDRFLLGASAGANAGTTGGSTTNVHYVPHTLLITTQEELQEEHNRH